MFGISYGELFLLIGATAALVGPKDLPIIARTVGRLAGRAVGYVQLARGQFDSVMQQSQARQVHKELQDTMAQLDAIRHEIRSLSLMNPGPLTRRLMENSPEATSNKEASGFSPEKREDKQNSTEAVPQDYGLKHLNSTNLHSQATAFARLADSEAIRSASLKGSGEQIDFSAEADGIPVLPVSAEGSGLLPKCRETPKGSDILLEAVLEADVAHNAKDFFSQPQNQILLNKTE